MKNAISAGVINLRHKILWRRLQPYSAAHAFALDAGGWEADGTIGSILGFIRICAAPVGMDCVPRGFPEIPPTFGDVFRALWLLRESHRMAAMEQIEAYLADHNTAPRLVWPSQEGAAPVAFGGSPIMAEVNLGVTKGGLTEHRAWSMPLGWLRTWNAHTEELEINPHKPRPQIVTDEDEDDFEQWDREHNPLLYSRI